MLFDLLTWRTTSPLPSLKSLEIRPAQDVRHVTVSFCNPWPSQIHDTETMHVTSLRSFDPWKNDGVNPALVFPCWNVLEEPPMLGMFCRLSRLQIPKWPQGFQFK